jgi:hypothetical protein
MPAVADLITAPKQGALAVTAAHGDDLRVHLLTAHLKAKLLSFPSRDHTDLGLSRVSRPRGR